MIRGLALCVLLCAGSAASTQTPSATTSSDVVKLLESAEPRLQAWGAWIAGRDHRRELVPALIARLDATRGVATFPESLVPLALLDALIQLRAEVPPAILRALPEHLSSQSTILMTIAGAVADQELLAIVDREEGLRWYTAANVLVQRRSPAVARLLLHGLRLSATLTVSAGGNLGSGFVGGMSATVGDGGSAAAPGYPPIAWYVLSAAGRPGSTVLSNGPKATYYERSLSEAGKSPAMHTHDISGPSMNDRIAYLAALVPSAVPFRSAYETFTLAWTTQGAVDAEVERIHADVRRRHDALVRKLIDLSLLSPDDIPFVTPTIDVQVRHVK